MMKPDKKYPKISVVTPNFNQVNFLEKTINSVLNQNYPNLEYIIIDGGSTDGSINVIKKYSSELHFWVSEEDNGMYDALNKGFNLSHGEIMCWINSDDILREGSLDYISKIFSENKKIHWVMGYPSIINELGKTVWEGQGAPIHSPYFFYLHNHLKTFSFLQQESTFWTRTLWNKTNKKLNLKYNLAADFDLWMQFFKYEKLYFSSRKLASFRKREGQKSEDQINYKNETNISIKINKKKLPLLMKINIIILKSIRKVMFSFKNKRIKKMFYKIQSFKFGKPNLLD